MDIKNSKSLDDSVNLLLSLSEGLLTNHRFPKIQMVDELILENNITDFQPYQISNSSFLATLHKSPKELKIFRLNSRLEYRYLTKVKLEHIPMAFTVYRDIFLISYNQYAEYIRIENKGKDIETDTRFSLWQNDEADQKYSPFPVFDEST